MGFTICPLRTLPTGAVFRSRMGALEPALAMPAFDTPKPRRFGPLAAGCHLAATATIQAVGSGTWRELVATPQTGSVQVNHSVTPNTRNRGMISRFRDAPTPDDSANIFVANPVRKLHLQSAMIS
jgi:hypothetical protein